MKVQLWQQTSVRQNLSSNLATRLLSALVSLGCVPIYLRILGASGYGLIGVWMTLESLGNLADLGLSATMTREMASASASSESAQNARDLARTLELVYWGIGLLLGAAVVSASPFLAAHWLNSARFTTEQLQRIIILIGVLILCRWPMSFYGGGVNGLERQVLMSWVSFAFGSAQSLGAVVVLLWVSPSIYTFFEWQVTISLFQTAILVILFWRCLPDGKAQWRPELLHRIKRFAGGLTGVAVVSLLLSDLDQIVVSIMLPLSIFGYYTLASKIAGTLYMAATPVFNAVFPAFSRLRLMEDTKTLSALYHHSAQLISILVLPLAMTIICFARPLIFAWTGNVQTAQQACAIAALLTAGTAFHCIGHVPWALQLAYGWNSLAFWSNFASVLISMPLLLLLTSHFGANGAAIVWPLVAVGFLTVQVPLMHRRLLRGELRQWLVEDTGFPFGVNAGAAILLMLITRPYQSNRFGAALVVFTSAASLSIITVAIMPMTRNFVRVLFKRFVNPVPA